MARHLLQQIPAVKEWKSLKLTPGRHREKLLTNQKDPRFSQKCRVYIQLYCVPWGGQSFLFKVQSKCSWLGPVSRWRTVLAVVWVVTWMLFPLFSCSFGSTRRRVPDNAVHSRGKLCSPAAHCWSHADLQTEEVWPPRPAGSQDQQLLESKVLFSCQRSENQMGKPLGILTVACTQWCVPLSESTAAGLL